MSINEKLSKIQKELKAPKGQFNSFGKYKYRSCEDILEAVKPHLDGLTLTLKDDVVLVGDRIYVKATATLSDGENTIETTAFARESENKKGMDESQITGTASSYSRKYALNGLFCIDDTKDADTDEFSQKKPEGRQAKAPAKPEKKESPTPARRRTRVPAEDVAPKEEQSKPEVKPESDDSDW